MSSNRIPAGAGTFRIVTEKREVRGRTIRARVLVFTSHDGFVGESRTWNHREAYEAAVAERAAAVFKVREAEMNRVPKPHERCDKPAPAAQLLHQIAESMLFSEVERRGYEVAIP